MLLLDKIDDPKLLDMLRAGKVGVMPTDTVYGLVCSAGNQQAVQRLYKLKSREHKPGTIIAANIEQLTTLGIPARYVKPVAHLWPNPLSIVVPCGPELDYLHLGKGSLAVRIPKYEALRKVLQRSGPLLTSSANLPGHAVAENLAEAEGYFGKEVDFYIDGGDLSERPSSTIIRMIDDEMVILREGVLSFDDKGEIINDTE